MIKQQIYIEANYLLILHNSLNDVGLIVSNLQKDYVDKLVLEYLKIDKYETLYCDDDKTYHLYFIGPEYNEIKNSLKIFLNLQNNSYSNCDDKIIINLEDFSKSNYMTKSEYRKIKIKDMFND